MRQIRFTKTCHLVLLIALLTIVSACASETVEPAQASLSEHTMAFPEPDPAACKELRELIAKTYNFKPSQVSDAQRTAKSAEMDVVWNRVKADPKTQIPCLAAELESPNANSFFRFDGSTLLYSLDKSDASKKLLIKSYAGADLEDIMLRNWIAYVLILGLEGHDTSAAGEAWLKAKDPFYYLPQHGARKVDRATGGLAIFGSMDEKYAAPVLERIASDKTHPGREIAVSLLSKLVTPEAFQAIGRIDRTGLSEEARLKLEKAVDKPTFVTARVGEPRITRNDLVTALRELGEGKAEKFMQHTVDVSDGEKDAVAVLLPEDVPLVRKARRFFASTGTPHAPEWYQSFTDILMVLVLKPEIDKRKGSKD